MKSFWSLSTLDKCTVMAAVMQSLSRANMTSLQMLAQARGESLEQVWYRCCRKAGVEPCTVPHHLFSRPEEIDVTGFSEELPAAIPTDTAGFVARTKLLAELQRSRAFQTRQMRAHAR